MLSQSQIINRLQAVPFWIVERSREIVEREKTGASEQREARGGAGKGERKRKGPFHSRFSPSLFSFISPRSSVAHPFDYPERDCLQSKV